MRRLFGGTALGLLLAALLPAQPGGPVQGVDPGHPTSGRPRVLQPITAGAVQALAIRNTPLGAVLDPATVPETGHGLFDLHGTSKARRALLYKARELALEEVRNQNAGTALELFWKLTAAQERCRLLDLGRAELAAQRARLEEAIAKEVKGTGERADFDLKMSKLASDDLALRVGLEQLHDQLGLLVGNKSCAPGYRPMSLLRVTHEEIDGCAAANLGLARRADLKIIRLFETQLDKRTLPMVQRWLAAVNPLLGPAQLKTLFAVVLRVVAAVPVEQAEMRDVRGQLQALREFREHQARLDILRQVEIVKLRQQDAYQARRRWEIQHHKLTALQEKAAQDLVGEAELSPVRVEVWKAEADMVQAAVEWELARVLLRQLQGLLATEAVEGPCVAPSIQPIGHQAVAPPPAFSPSGSTSGVTGGAPPP